MKSCPTCNRTFEDSFTFCLIDGAVLSAPFDPKATKRIPAARATKAPVTEVLPSHMQAQREDLPPTVPSPELMPTMPHVPLDHSPANSRQVAVEKIASTQDSLGGFLAG